MIRSFRLATAVAAALVGGSLLLRLLNPFAAPPPDPSDLVPHLWGIAALLVVALTWSWAPTLAWVALVIGTAASALGAVELVRAVRAARVDDPVTTLAALVVVALLVSPAIAAAYATRDGRRSRALVALAWATVLVLGGAMSVALLVRTLTGERGGVPEWLWMAVIGVLLGMGLVHDLGPVLGRTRVRAAAPGAGGRDSGALSLLRIFLDELVPGREAARAEAIEDERSRIAADLHADVLPSLRRALAAAEASSSVERLAVDLRSAVDEVESLLAARRAVVLEELGLLAALEWLAERVEDRSTVRVGIEVEDAGTATGQPGGEAPPGGEARPPRDVERAAFRIAQLALDNVVRHAPGATVRVTVATGPRAVGLRIEDDAAGPPIDEAAALRRGRRGIADMRAEARACGARLDVGRATAGCGTAVDLRWPA